MKDVEFKSVPAEPAGADAPSISASSTERVEIFENDPQSGVVPDLRIPPDGSTPKLERVIHLFQGTPLNPASRFVAVVRSHPVERFIAAIAWWPEGSGGRFQLACQPGVARATVAGKLIESLEACARQAGLKAIQFANLLSEENEWLGILKGYGFERLHSERSFEIAWSDAWTRVMDLHQKHRSQIPAGWRTEPIRNHPPEMALDLIAPHRLMPPAEVRNLWRNDAQGGFDPDLSCILFEGQRPFGVFLTRRMGDALYVDVQVVWEPNRLLRSLGSILLLHHDAQHVAREGSIRSIRLRSGQAEHLQTANLALRMGGREVARCHLMGKTL